MKYDNSCFRNIINPRPLKKPLFPASSFLSPFLCSLQRKEGKRKGNGGKKNRQGGEKTLRSLGRTGAELRQPLRRGSTKGLGHFSPVAVPANRRLSRKTARELPVSEEYALACVFRRKQPAEFCLSRPCFHSSCSFTISLMVIGYCQMD